MGIDFSEIKNQYQELPTYAATRHQELSNLLRPYVQATDYYGGLITGLTLLLGQSKPVDDQDRIVRDLMADAFAFLYEGRRIVLQGQLEVAYPLIRRAYETVSLLALCVLDRRYADKWQTGAQIGNAKVRAELDKHPLGEQKDRTRELYQFFSKAAHPNRELVAQKYLGEVNEFVLGAIGIPSMALVVDYCIKHLQIWFWLTAVLAFRYKELIEAQFPDWGGAYAGVAKNATEALNWLGSQFDHLLEEEQNQTAHRHS